MALAEQLPEPPATLAGPRAIAHAALARARQRVEPAVLARDRSLPVLSPLAPLLPDGLRRGSTVAVAGGPGATALALALAAGPSVEGAWVATTSPSLGLLAAAEAGVAVERLLVLPEVPAASVATVLAALLDAVDVVLVGRSPSAAECRRLSARARERGAVLVALPGAGRWGQAPDVVLTAGRSTWEAPAGRLARRRLEVRAGGRGSAARERRATLWLPGASGGVEVTGGVEA
jgi:hypothetical protein